MNAATGELLDDAALEASSVVANNAMNRERQLAGVNSYTRELGFNPVDVLIAKLDAGAESVAWLDLCCGSGRALTQAAAHLRAAGLADRATLVGVDLVDTFLTAPGPELICSSLTAWTPDRTFDLITCVHGLHYIGDKLAVLTRAATWLTATGRFVADLDLTSIRARGVSKHLRAAGFTYRAHRITRTGPGRATLPYTYRGAREGANYTGQPGVHSHYDEQKTPAGGSHPPGSSALATGSRGSGSAAPQDRSDRATDR